MKKHLYLGIILILSAVINAQAGIELPEIIGDNMVLQQQSNVKLWGKATPKVTITAKASWTETTVTTQADANGKWSLHLNTPAGSYHPQSIELSDGTFATTINNILIGEVWFCSGQSNMEMPLHGFWNNPIMDANKTIAQAGNYKGLRFVNIEHREADTPQENCYGKWKVSNPQEVPHCSATACHFALTLEQTLNVPVGIINCSWGGSRVEGWLPEWKLKTYPDINLVEEMKHEHVWFRPMIMYNAMLKPLQNYTIKGFLWYQGESNVGKHDTYAQRLAEMVELWRSEWKLGDLPFYYVEIAPYNYGWGEQGAFLREAQFKAQALIPASGMVSTNDLVEPYEANNIHPRNKTQVGERLAYMALVNTYTIQGIEDRGPVYRSMELKEGKAYLSFDYARNGFNRMDGIVGFEMAGEDRIFYPAQAIVTGEKMVIVSCEEVPQPVAVRYGFRNFLPGNLAGTRELPVYPFRTDSWAWDPHAK
ncbi:sialate O-acetylesterase [Bacteroides sp. 214]|uniref:sialate O-acetylesterase n=1 Tax=Bacteroides sp. 214 TaxID=2302935 RepID=UPI0013D58CD7|nr:sialate O-acetylesterase [Bacteroides sp. 214]NDW13686.1 sialate O-acetylesterase [Bacteroides sp. 214]